MIESWRIFFPTAALLAVAGLGAWAAQLLGVPLGIPPLDVAPLTFAPLTIAPSDHAAFMLFGVLGSGVFGFLLTAYAKQNDAPLPGRATLGVLWVLQVAAAAFLLLRPALPGPLGVFVATAPWLGLLGWALTVAVPSLRRRWEATTATIPLALAAGALGVGLHAGPGAVEVGARVVRGVDLGVWPFLTLLAWAVLDRVLPFFSGRAHPGWSGGRRPFFLGAAAALLWLRLVVPAPVPDLALLVLLARQWAGWQPWPAGRVPMITILHVGVAWFVVALALSMGGAPSSVVIHALVVGGLGSLLLGISMRVVRGHGGLPLVLGRAGLGVVLLAQAAAVVRVVAGGAGLGAGALALSAALLAGAFAVWLGRFGRTCLPAPGRA